ncbi:NAD dependent epimerase/dehydratase family protein [Halenospora varia]|nr:NAD dependent epimerase/dehydratase family protein [Halenospora varia]
MPSVLIIGATGYIGQSLCSSLLRSGEYRIFGLARTPQKAKDLEKEEVIPIHGSISDHAAIQKAVETHHIGTVGKKRLSDAAKEGVKVQKLGFIYCSGTWVHGSSPNEAVDDLTPVDCALAPRPSAELTSWRPKLEREVLAASEVLDVMVVRPALVYGRSHAIWAMYFGAIADAAKKGEDMVEIAADIDSRPGLIHVDDVASGFHAAIEKLAVISGTGVYPVFDLVTSQEGMRDIMEFAARELGFAGSVELVGAGDDLFAKAMNTSMNNNAARAKQILGWQPKRIGFVQGMDVYAKAFAAARL